MQNWPPLQPRMLANPRYSYIPYIYSYTTITRIYQLVQFIDESSVPSINLRHGNRFDIEEILESWCHLDYLSRVGTQDWTRFLISFYINRLATRNKRVLERDRVKYDSFKIIGYDCSVFL